VPSLLGGCPHPDEGLIEAYDSDRGLITSWLPNRPTAVATDSYDNVYYSTGKQIAKSDSEGNLLAAWGSGVGQFYSPGGVAVDSQDNVYVYDRGNEYSSANRIEKFDSDGRFITEWGSHGSGDGQFLFGSGLIATDSEDNVYIHDAGPSEDGPINRIQKFDSDGNFLTKWGSQGGADGRFASVEGMATDSEDNVYVVDNHYAGSAFVAESRIQKFTSVGEFVESWSSDQFKHPRPIAFDSEDNLYVGDLSSRILKFAVDNSVRAIASAKRTQIKRGPDIKVSVRIRAQEKMTVQASGIVKAGPAYKLKTKTKSVGSGKTKTLKLKPKKKDAKKIAKALKNGKKAKAKLTVKLTDEAGNKKTEKLAVKLKR